MIDPRCPVSSITIEASLEPDLAGECAIDLAEYSESADGKTSVHYVQLKHSTVRKRKSIGLRDLGETLGAFSARLLEHHTQSDSLAAIDSIGFSFVTNRNLAPKLSKALHAISEGGTIPIAQRRQLEAATGLQGDQLQSFITSLVVADGEGDYVVQHQQLHGELAEYLAGFVESEDADKIVNLVSERALPHPVKGRRKGEILREDVLQRLGVTSDRDLFPAPREFEILPHIIQREQHDDLVNHVMRSTSPVIIHAAGGVGKSVVARQIAEGLPKGSLGLVYDCFGSGKYRNPSEPRHRACDALVQIANELAASGYCRMLVMHPGTLADALFRSFFSRLKEAVQALREIEPTALLVILIDAADNAEMAAQENSDKCFANGLLREQLPEGCRLVALCRTERSHMLKPKSSVIQLPLEPFSEKETAAHLRSVFPEASDDDVREFHRLTGGNPRVQANGLRSGRQTIEEILASLGPSVTTVAAQISGQLQSAVAGIKDRSIAEVSIQVDAICSGLANLPPFIPTAVLAKAAQVEEPTILSFVSDLGHPLWHSDSSVMFRDEPTETWFREQFAGDSNQVKKYVELLAPLAKDFPYVAKALPQLLLRSGDYARLIELALSDEFLPDHDPIDARNIRVYRLQFAFRAALRLDRIADAAQLAFRAGEEVAGDQRQLLLLRQNLEMVAPLLDPTRVQELAYRQLLSGGWQGSANVYSASLLSSVEDFKGEARGYLRASEKWLTIFFEERSKRDKRDMFRERLQDADLAEMAWAYFNLLEAEGLVHFLFRWRPPEVILRLGRLIVRRLIDAARFDEIEKLALEGRKSAYLILAVADELEAVARFPPKNSLKPTLALLARRGIKRARGLFLDNTITDAIVSFCEAGAFHKLSTPKILAVLDCYTETTADSTIGGDYHEQPRSRFLRGIALRAALACAAEPAPRSLLPKKDDESRVRLLSSSEEENLIQVIGGLLPWYYLRARLIARDTAADAIDLEGVREASKSARRGRYRAHDRLPYEISPVWFSVLALKGNATEEEMRHFTKNVLDRAAQKFLLNGRLDALRVACRSAHLAPLRSALEQSCVAAVEPMAIESPEERADSYIRLARAVVAVSASDASTYFIHAIDAVSRFGDEMIPRWEAIVAVARRVADGGRSSEQTAYRFFKCAEIVGASVAREKYWSRSDVFRVGVCLHAPSAFAALSRWRDREVGWFARSMSGLATEAVNAGEITALTGWCLSGFLACNADSEFATRCIRREADHLNQQYILDATIRDVELAGGGSESLQRLSAVAEEFALKPGKLLSLLASYKAASELIATSAEAGPPHSHREQLQASDWDEIFNGVDVLNSEGIALAEARYRSGDPPFMLEDFWGELVRRVPSDREIEFLKFVPLAESIDSYDAGNLLIPIRGQWLKKAAVKARWPEFMRSLGKRHAATLTEAGTLEYWTNWGRVDESDLRYIKAGIVRGLAESFDLVDARTFFGFVANVAADLTPTESGGLLDYGLSRFELHIDNDFGDGPWDEWLRPPQATSDAVAGFIWSALASPLSSTRWEAVHCVRRLVEAGCEAEVDALIGWLQRNSVGAFGSHRFPFYQLHARLYFLIALARTTCDVPLRLYRHASIFASLALTGMPHILIQKTAADIALAIEGAQPGAFSVETTRALRKVGNSPFPLKQGENYSASESTPWHVRGEIKKGLNVNFGIDFDAYWFNYLGHVFGVPPQEVIELAEEAAVQYLRVASGEDYRPDPRAALWESRDYYERGTDHSHSSYPRNDDYWFYYSYHSFLSVASRLLGAMPVIRGRDDDESESNWEEWLSRHSLTRSDGRWLVDRRDPSPLKRRAWTKGLSDREWRWSLGADDFLDVLLHQSPQPGWLSLAGSWTECSHERIESIRVSSALVTPETSQALADSLRHHENPFQYRLPSYGDTDKDLQSYPFELTGWIHRARGNDKRLDGFDPYACELEYPPYEIGASFAAMLGVESDYERRTWCRASDGEVLFVSELWSEKDAEESDRAYREGERISGAASELCRLCSLLGKHLIFSVEINRSIHRYRGSSSDDIGYLPASHKIFVLSANGELRDARQSHQIG
ncbi:hypothetical protein [Haloferula sp. BvORR071]|uniref:hypothetical protein n=1 Tax=Haloferula sp. BvORR071 TaxID=1396141 RepID=UPI000696F6F4|nr:hypothetical protein [Haloferula sp. BvORR071]